MSATYLLMKEQPDGTVGLSLATREEWLEAIHQGEHRYFIRDCIVDQGQMDCIVIETTEEEYRKWNKERMASQRNRQNRHGIQMLSLDEGIQSADGELLFRDTVEADDRTEELAIDSIQMKDLRHALAAWRPWGVEILDLYLASEQKACVPILARKYRVSPQTARKYKRQFESFLKKFLRGVSF